MLIGCCGAECLWYSCRLEVVGGSGKKGVQSEAVSKPSRDASQSIVTRRANNDEAWPLLCAVSKL